MANATQKLPRASGTEARGAALAHAALECHRLALEHATARRIHDARRALKRLRAILRLAETVGVPVARTLRKRLTLSARELSPLRDAAVVTATAARIARRSGTAEVPALRLDSLRSDAWWRDWIARLDRERHAIRRLRWDQLDSREIRRALRRSARRVRKRARRAAYAVEVAPVHEWRKAVIVLREQLDVLRATSSRRERTARSRLAQLARRLGRVMDCTVLLAALCNSGESPDTRELARAAGRRRQRALKRAWSCWPTIQRALRRGL